MRISLVIGIYKVLHIYFGEKWADRWVTLGNRTSMFAGAAPIEYFDSPRAAGNVVRARHVGCLARPSLTDPPVRFVRWERFHRFLPSRYSERVEPCSPRLPGIPKSSVLLNGDILVLGEPNRRPRDIFTYDDWRVSSQADRLRSSYSLGLIVVFCICGRRLVNLRPIAIGYFQKMEFLSS